MKEAMERDKGKRKGSEGSTSGGTRVWARYEIGPGPFVRINMTFRLSMNHSDMKYSAE